MSSFPFSTRARRDDLEHGHMVVQQMVEELGSEVATPSGPFVPGTNGDLWTTVAGVPVWSAPTPPVGQEKAYNGFTSPVSITATTEATANTIVTASTFTADGTSAYLIELFSPSVKPAAASVLLTFVLYEDGSSIGKIGEYSNSGTNPVPLRIPHRMIPASGSRTYSIRAYTASGTATIGAGAGAGGNLMPGSIRITKVT